VVLSDAEFSVRSHEEAVAKAAEVVRAPRVGEIVNPNSVFITTDPNRQSIQVAKEQLIAALENPNSYADLFCQTYMARKTLSLTGGDRIQLV